MKRILLGTAVNILGALNNFTTWYLKDFKKLDYMTVTVDGETTYFFNI